MFTLRDIPETVRNSLLAYLGIRRVASLTTTIAPGAVGAGVVVTTTVAVAACLPGDFVTVTSQDPALSNSILLQGHVSVAGTVSVQFANISAGGITPASAVYNITVTRQDS